MQQCNITNTHLSPPLVPQGPVGHSSCSDKDCISPHSAGAFLPTVQTGKPGILAVAIPSYFLFPFHLSFGHTSLNKLLMSTKRNVWSFYQSTFWNYRNRIWLLGPDKFHQDIILKEWSWLVRSTCYTNQHSLLLFLFSDQQKLMCKTTTSSFQLSYLLPMSNEHQIKNHGDCEILQKLKVAGLKTDKSSNYISKRKEGKRIIHQA